jgi:hypothetical protein
MAAVEDPTASDDGRHGEAHEIPLKDRQLGGAHQEALARQGPGDVRSLNAICAGGSEL